MRRKELIFLVFAAILSLSLLAAGCKKDKDIGEASPGDKQEMYQQDEYEDEYEDNVEESPDQEYEEDGEEYENIYGPDSQEAMSMMLSAYQDMKEEAASDPVRQKEVTPQKTAIEYFSSENLDITREYADVCTISMDGRKMQYTMEIIGEPDEIGLYPLYITLHGGGESSPQSNNGQWLEMMEYYRDSVDYGIYVAVRGMEDVWNTHFLDESYPMYDRLIEDMILLKNADPNRVYLLGFSAGSDGVFAVAPRMADRFAAVNMSSGHPNGVSLLNTSNLPVEIQVGIRDFYSEDVLRSVKCAEYEEILNGYNKTFGFGYPHRVLVHVPEGHLYTDYLDYYNESLVLKYPAQFSSRAYAEDIPGKLLEFFASMGNDDDFNSLSYESADEIHDSMVKYITEDLGFEVEKVNTDAVAYVDQYEREPCPDSFIWDLTTRAKKRKDTAFYWLKADNSVDTGLIEADYKEESNTVYLNVMDDPNGEIMILASPFLMDFDRPLTIVMGDEEMTVELKADKKIIEDSLKETGDVLLAWADEISVSSLF